jgi:hypothetical protein
MESMLLAWRSASAFVDMVRSLGLEEFVVASTLSVIGHHEDRRAFRGAGLRTGGVRRHFTTRKCATEWSVWRIFFRPSGARLCSFPAHPRLTPWAAFYRRSAATLSPSHLQIEEAVAILIVGEDADFRAAEDAVAVTGYSVVGGVAEEFGQELQ